VIRSLARPRELVVGAMLALGALATLGITALAGTKTGVALAFAAVVGPLAAYGAIFAPLVFPFTFYVMLVPFDNLLSTAAFGTVTRLLAILCGASIVFWLIRTRRAIMPERSVFLWGLLWLWSAVSLTWAIDPAFGYTRFFTFTQLLALYFAVSLVPIDRRTLRIVVAGIILGSVIAAGYGAYLFGHGIDTQSGRLFLSNDVDVVYSGHIDPNHFAAALILPIALALTGLLRARALGLRAVYAIALLAMGAGIAVSGSRGSMLAVAVILIYIMVRARTNLLAAGVAVALLSITLTLNSDIGSRIALAVPTGGAGRLDIWRVGLAAFREHLWVGAGYANFPLAFDNAFIGVSEHYYTHWHRVPHNIVLSAGVELGVIGLIIFLCAWFVQFRALRAIKRTDPLYSVRIAAEGALIGLFVAGIFLDTMDYKYQWLAFMLVMLIRNASLAPVRTHAWQINSYPITAQPSTMRS
jgi:O-antigen ligase